MRRRKVTKEEQKLLDRAGQWVIRDGKFYDPELKVWVLKCEECKITYGAKRRHSRTCSKAHQKARQRQLHKQPLFRPSQTA